MKKCLFLLILLIFFSTIGSSQNNQLEGNKKFISFSKGAVVSSASGMVDNELYETKQVYDLLMIGVATGNNNPIKFDDYIKTKGVCLVKYNISNGKIQRGDPVTSSSVPGEAMKATQPGMILGVAMEDGDGSSPFIKVRVMIQYFRP